MRNINLPKTKVYIRCDAFGGSDKEFETAWLISVRSLRNRPLCFQVWVEKYAACYDKIPPHCLYWKMPESNNNISLPLSKIQIWGCLSGSIEFWQKAQLVDSSVMVNLGKNQKPIFGNYWFTIDFIPENQEIGIVDIGESEILEEHKECNVIKLTNGQVAIYPNNRLKWMPISLTPQDAVNKIPDWKVATNEKWENWWNESETLELFGDSDWNY